jgi:hypothetical protein
LADISQQALLIDPRIERLFDCLISNELQRGIHSPHRHQSTQLYPPPHIEFYLTREARQLLTTLDKPIAVVSIAGVYRTGKSYLVNRLLKTKQTGFQTGSTTQSVTKGLNMWGRPIVAEDENGNEMLYIVIDSEGIGSCEQ